MRLAKIKNKYMFDCSKYDSKSTSQHNKSINPEGIHYYLVFYDRKRKCYKAIQLTHLYYKDGKRFEQVKKGTIIVEKFKEFEVPSGVKSYVYYVNSSGNKIDIKDKENVVSISSRNISTKQSKRIIEFVDKKENPGNQST